MAWEVAKHGQRSCLVGTAHFFPYHFRGALARLIGAARSVLFEGPLDAQSLYRELLFGRPSAWLEDELRGLKPWLGFFGLWSRYRARHGGNYSLDLDAQRIAAGQGKDPRYLETIEEQIAAARAFPTFCEAVIERRDPILAERMIPAIDAGNACVFVGITHIPGVTAQLRANGCEVAPLSP